MDFTEFPKFSGYHVYVFENEKHIIFAIFFQSVLFRVQGGDSKSIDKIY